LEYTKSLPDKYFDLCIADPPYGIGIATNPFRQKHEKKDWDNQIPTQEILKEMQRVSTHCIIWGGNYFGLPANKHFIIWDKKQPFDFSSAMCEYAWSNIDKPAKIFSYRVTTEKNKIHPTQKPIALYAWILDNYAKQGDKIFDPFLGIGSSRIAAYKKGFDFYACELDKAYYEAQEERFRKECLGEIKQSNGTTVTQMTLF
jgi:site-specific DNA-methyltransferase (adenine-specific)